MLIYFHCVYYFVYILYSPLLVSEFISNIMKKKKERKSMNLFLTFNALVNLFINDDPFFVCILKRKGIFKKKYTFLLHIFFCSAITQSTEWNLYSTESFVIHFYFSSFKIFIFCRLNSKQIFNALLKSIICVCNAYMICESNLQVILLSQLMIFHLWINLRHIST